MTILHAPKSTPLLELLELHAGKTPEKLAFKFLIDESTSTVQSYAALLMNVRAVGATLQEHGEAGGRVLILCPPGLAYIQAFLGCTAAGMIAVPAYPPTNERMMQRLVAQLRDSGAQTILSTATLVGQIEPWLAALGLGTQLRLLAVEHAAQGAAALWHRPDLAADRACFIQYTSGSTREPRGVVVSQGNLIANQAMIQEAFGTAADSVIVSWLPMYHDMGLIGMLHTLYLGASCVLLSPVDFLRRPYRWLQAITDHRATVSGGPNFAFELCRRRITHEERAAFDLSTWRTAYNGAEPIHAATLEAFALAFADCGFRKESFLPCYGLAEATLLASGTAAPRPVLLRELGGRTLVGCGQPAQGRLLIVDPTSRIAVGAGQEGEIWISGRHVAKGYWGREQESAETFAAQLSDTGEGPFLRTGDLGVLADGEVFVTGRIKDLIIVRGRNHYPQDLEHTVAASYPDLRPGCGAAFSVSEAGQERVIIVQEAERGRDLRGAFAAIRQAIAREHDLHVHAIVLVEPRTIAKTSSGKIQRSACRAAFLEGTLVVLAAATSELPSEPTGEEADSVLSCLRTSVARVLDVAPTSISSDEACGSLGLDSLMAIELAHATEERFGVVVPASAFLGASTLRELAAQVTTHSEFHSLSRSARREGPLSEGQAALWLFQQLQPESRSYHVAIAARVLGRLDRDTMRAALGALVRRHPILRTVYDLREGEPFQRVLAELDPEFGEQDVRGASDADMQQFLERETARPFDLRTGPVFRTALFDRGSDQILLFTAHHIAVDLWSLVLLIADLRELYTGRAVGSAGLEYLDFVAHQASWLASSEGERGLQFWQEQLQGAPLLLELPSDRPRLLAGTDRGATTRFALDRELVQALVGLARSAQTTLHTVLLAAFQTLLFRITRQEDLIVGVAAANRPRAAFNSTVGYFVNTLPLRVNLSGSPSFAEVLAQARQVLLGALENQSVPFASMVERMPHPRDPGRTPFIQAMFVLEKPQRRDLLALSSFILGEGSATLPFGDATLVPYARCEQGAPFDLMLQAVEIPEGLAASMQYRADLFDAERIRSMVEQFEAILRQIVRDPQQPIHRIELLSPGERQRILVDFNATTVPYPHDMCVHELFAREARRQPDALALICSDGSLTYRELDEQANVWANRLRSKGVGPETPVGLCAQRSLEMVVALLAIVKAGGIYVPIDADHPQMRLRRILRDCDIQLVLGHRALLDRLPLERECTLALDEPWPGEPAASGPPLAFTPDQLLYVMYTSGSTGEPSGVAVTHAGVVRLVRGTSYVHFGAGEIFLQFAPLTFDASTFEIWGPLLNGGALFIPPPGQTSLAELAELIQVGNVSTLWLTAGLFAQMAEEHAAVLGRVRQLLSGGDVVSPLAAERVLRAGVRRFVNGYGPTEATTFTCCASFADASEIHGPLPIGRPIENTRVYIVDPDLLPVPLGIAGELFVAGAGLARGYWSRPALTASRFIPDPFSEIPGARMYRTGDLARWRRDGTVEFLGRMDNQLKVRGFRIEPAEIEAALREHPSVRAALVVPAAERGPAASPHLAETTLAAYVLLNDPSALPTLREYLAAKLPAYMLPAFILAIDQIPYTPNGKLDRQRLPRPVYAENPDGYLAPRDAIEAVLAEVWTGVLGVARVGIHDNFFAIGGHSLLATQVLSRVGAALGVALSMRTLFERPTIAGLAESVRGAADHPARVAPLRPWDRNQDAPLSFAQERLWFIDNLDPGNPAYNIPLAIRLEGELSVPALRSALQDLVRRHEAFRTRFPLASGAPVVQVVPEWDPGCLTLAELAVESGPDADLVLAEARQPFDLAVGPLLRCRLLRLGAREHMLLLTMHHIVSDGWSLGVMLRDLAALYRSRQDGSPVPLAPRVAYRDYAAWQRERSHAAALVWWQERLAGAPSVLELPVDRPRLAAQRYQGAKCRFTIEAAVVARLIEQGRRVGATLFMSLLSAFGIILHRYTREDDFLIGVPVAGRDHPDIEDVVGCFVNTLPIRMDLSRNPTFMELLSRVRDSVLQDLGNAQVPFEQIVEAVKPERDPRWAPLVQVMFALQNLRLGPVDLSGVTATPIEIDNATGKFDLDLTFTEVGGLLNGVLEYDTARFEADTMSRMASHITVLLAEIAAAPETPVGFLRMLSPAAERRLKEQWNTPAYSASTQLQVESPAALPLFPEAFARQVARCPDAKAVTCQGRTLRYAELARDAAHCAAAFAGAGVQRESVVAFLLDRGIDFLVGMLAAFELGAAYLPIDPKQPEARLRSILAATRCAAVYTVGCQVELAERLVQGECPLVLAASATPARGADFRLDRNAAKPSSLAYVIFTSGSTGNPKGVMIEHAGLANHLRAKIAGLALGQGDVIAQVATQTSDVSVWQFLAGLLVGAEIVVFPDESAWEPTPLLHLLSQHDVTVLETVPTHMRSILDELEARPQQYDLAALRWLMLNGEALPAPLCCRWHALYPDIPIINAYGPAECSDDVTHHFLFGPPPEHGFISIGRVLPNLSLAILDDHLMPVPEGIVGELCVGGEGVGRGYLGAPSGTARSFIPDPFAVQPGRRLYRTGDRVRLVGGAIEFLGRLDHQFKIRGFRVEVGEIEAALRAHPKLLDAVVEAYRDKNDELRLAAYVVPQPDAALDSQQLHVYLGQQFAGHMQPSAYVFLSQLPCLTSGKIDRRALPSVTDCDRLAHRAGEAPKTPTEAVLTRLWSEVLAVPGIGAADNFFDLGGHSLLGIRLMSHVRIVFAVDLSVRVLFDHPTIAGLASEIDAVLGRRDALDLPLLNLAARGDARPLSFAQERLWFLEQLEPQNALYNMFGAFQLTGELDAPKLASAFDALVARHESLRTRIFIENGEPKQELLPSRSLAIVAEPCDPEFLQLRIAEEATRPFELTASEPLLRVRLLRLAPGDHVLLVSMHHITADARSIQVAMRELAVVYGGGELDPLPIQYADFAYWQRQALGAARLEAKLSYWKQQLACPLPVLDLPSDRPRPRIQSARGAMVRFCLPRTLADTVRLRCREESATPFMLLLTAFGVLLHRYTGQMDLIVGSPISGRDVSEVDNAIGFFVNTIALRLDLSQEPSGREVLRRVREVTLDAYAHREVPFERIVDALQVDRDLGRAPIFSVMFALQEETRGRIHLPGLDVHALDVHTGTAKFDLSVFILQSERDFAVEIEFKTDLFESATITRLFGHYQTLLAALVAAPELPIGLLPMLTAGEQEQLASWNCPPLPALFPKGETVHSLFSAQVRRTPTALALKDAKRSLSYDALDCWSNRLAHRLIKLGVGPETVVGVYMERSLEMIVGLLAILKAGGAYLPLDLSYPEERLAMMIEDARVPLLLTTDAHPCHFSPSTRWVEVDRCENESEASPDVAVDENQLAYVIFTSGSTGRPKGVMYPHVGTVNRLRWQQHRFPLGQDDRVLQKTPFSFDVSVWEFFWPLATGAVLVLARPEGHQDSGYLLNLIVEHSITTIHFVPSMLETFLAESGVERCTSLRRVIASGEALSADLQQRFFARLPCALHNQYGPTESGEVSDWAACRDDRRAMVPIGGPLFNVQLHVLDPHLALVPVGVPGELYIGGIALARGYYGRPELTAARFIPDPLAATPGSRLYRTGDLVRRLPDGTLDFMRRLDTQIKLHGQRIELGEIEAALRALAGIRQAAVLLRENSRGQPGIVGYLVAAPDSAPAVDGLRAMLARTLPYYMIPTSLVWLPALPLTPSGKLNTAALPSPDEDIRAEFVAPRSALEEVLVKLWSELLGREDIGVRDSFFDLGGHSLLAVRLIALVQDLLGVQVPLRALFEAQSVETFALALLAREVELEESALLLLSVSRLPDETVEEMLRTQETPHD